MFNFLLSQCLKSIQPPDPFIMLLRIMGRKSYRSGKLLRKKVRNFYTGRKKKSGRRKKYIQRPQEGKKELRTKWSCFKEGMLFLITNQNQYFEE